MLPVLQLNSLKCWVWRSSDNFHASFISESVLKYIWSIYTVQPFSWLGYDGNSLLIFVIDWFYEVKGNHVHGNMYMVTFSMIHHVYKIWMKPVKLPKRPFISIFFQIPYHHKSKRRKVLHIPSSWYFYNYQTVPERPWNKYLYSAHLAETCWQADREHSQPHETTSDNIDMCDIISLSHAGCVRKEKFLWDWPT